MMLSRGDLALAGSILEEAEALKQDYILQLKSGGRILSYRWAKWRRENGLPLSIKGKGGASL